LPGYNYDASCTLTSLPVSHFDSLKLKILLDRVDLGSGQGSSKKGAGIPYRNPPLLIKEMNIL
jgi:hypothetical protein